MTGRYTITIKYGGDNIPYSPYNVQAFPTGDASKCLLTGIFSILVLSKFRNFFPQLWLTNVFACFYFQCLLEDIVLVRNQEMTLYFNELLYNGGIFSAIINVLPLHQVISFQGLILWF